MQDFHLEYRCEECNGQRFAIERTSGAGLKEIIYFRCLTCGLEGLHECPKCLKLTTEAAFCVECFIGEELREARAYRETADEHLYFTEM